MKAELLGWLYNKTWKNTTQKWKFPQTESTKLMH